MEIIVRPFTQRGCLVLTYVLWIATADSKNLAVRDTPNCYGAGNDTFSASVANVIACFNYLVSVGHTACPAAAGTLSPGLVKLEMLGLKRGMRIGVLCLLLRSSQRGV